MGLENATDSEIFEYAKSNDYTIVSFDADFCGLSVLRGFPPKIIWIRTGNTTTKNLEILLKSKSEVILQFFNENFACLEIIE